MFKKVLFSSFFFTLVACGVDTETARSTVNNLSEHPMLQTRSFALITPTGVKVMQSSLKWVKAQELEADSYAQPAQCARNVSRVLRDAGLSHYSSPLVDDLIWQIKQRGGEVISLPKSRAAITSILNSKFKGRLPVGTLIAGCLNADCSGQAGDGHVAIVGDRDAHGRWQAYHNNWYRPDNEGGVWKPHMIPVAWYQRGYLRKWMPTPWLSPQVDSNMRLQTFSVSLPAIDDLDPINYYIRLGVPAEIMKEYKSGKGFASDGKGKVVKITH